MSRKEQAFLMWERRSRRTGPAVEPFTYNSEAGQLTAVQLRTLATRLAGHHTTAQLRRDVAVLRSAADRLDAATWRDERHVGAPTLSILRDQPLHQSVQDVVKRRGLRVETGNGRTT